MKLVYKSRGGGKTTELIKESAKSGAYLVCHSRSSVEWAFQLAKEMELDIPFPITFDEFLKKEYYAKGIKGFLIDNADMLLQRMSGVPITAISITDYRLSSRTARNDE